MADKLHVGKVGVNGTSHVRIDSMPFRGFKKSDVGREGIRHAVHESTTRSSDQEPANQDDGAEQGCRTAEQRSATLDIAGGLREGGFGCRSAVGNPSTIAAVTVICCRDFASGSRPQ